MFRYLLCVCLVLSGCAGTKQTAYIDHPIRVTGEGKTFEEAKKNAFSNAMEYAVGAVVVTENQVQNRRLVKDDIIKHSSGYVDDYTIVNRIDESDHVTLVMDVKVKHSNIAERIINVRTASGEVQGSRLDGMYSSYMQTRQTGDSLLSTVLNDYPNKAFNVETEGVQYMLNINRLPVIVVQYKITWNYKYLQALNEALEQTQSPKDRNLKQDQIHVISKSPTAWLLGSTDKYYFNDHIRTDMIRNKLNKIVFVKTTLKDGAGNIIKVGCDNGRVISGTRPNDVYVVEGNMIIEEQNERIVRTNLNKIKDITTVEVTVESTPCTFID